MIHLADFRMRVVRPTLQKLDSEIQYSLAAANLLIGTALHESKLYSLAQQGGPALGFWQMEPATYDDLWRNFINNRPMLRGALIGLTGGGQQDASALITNLALACAMARIQYYRAPQPMPAATDAAGMATVYKAVYNTAQGAATVAQVIPDFQQAIDA